MVLPLGDVEKTRIVPIGTYALIALNVVVYLLQLDKGAAFTTAYAATPYEITRNEDLAQPFLHPLPGQGEITRNEDLAQPFLHPLPGQGEVRPIVIDQAPVPFHAVWLTLLTSLFLHGSPLHLASNMLCLWIFGDNVEEVLGTLNYLVVYLACGLMGTLAQVAANPDSLIPTLGASGAIAGIMGAYVVWFPHNRVRVLMLRVIVLLPAFVVIGVWIALQIWEGFDSVGHLGEIGGVAYFAHLGGAATGLLVAWLFKDRARALRERNAQDEWIMGV